VEGYAKALEEFDAWLPSLYAKLSSDDLLIVTADHGCDPTTPSTDHSREYVPLLVYPPRKPEGTGLGVRSTLSDIGQTVAENFGVKISEGTSFLEAVA
jgi:phosphopentomutase